MAKFSESMVSEELLPEEIESYKPLSPTAVSSLLCGIAAVIAAITAADVGWAFAAVPIIGFALGVRGLGAIRRYDMAGKGAARAGVILSTLALAGGTGGYLYYLKTTVPPGYERISYDPLQTPTPEAPGSSAKALDGKKIYIQGYMYPTNQSRGIRSFTLCRDNGTCCFGGQPKLTDMIAVTLKPPLTVDFTSSLHGVGGVFRVRTEKAPGQLGAVVYHIDNADVIH